MAKQGKGLGCAQRRDWGGLAPLSTLETVVGRSWCVHFARASPSSTGQVIALPSQRCGTERAPAESRCRNGRGARWLRSRAAPGCERAVGPGREAAAPGPGWQHRELPAASSRAEQRGCKHSLRLSLAQARWAWGCLVPALTLELLRGSAHHPCLVPRSPCPAEGSAPDSLLQGLDVFRSAFVLPVPAGPAGLIPGTLLPHGAVPYIGTEMWMRCQS